MLPVRDIETTSSYGSMTDIFYYPSPIVYFPLETL